MISPLLLPLVALVGQDPDPVAFATAPPPRTGRVRLELALLGEPFPLDLAKAIRYSGAGELDNEALDTFLDARQSLWALRPREYGMQVIVEGPERHFDEVLAAITPGIVDPTPTPQGLQAATIELLIGRTPGERDPIAAFERELAGLIDPRMAPPSILDFDLGALFGGGSDGEGGPEDGGGEDEDRDGGADDGGGFQLPPIPGFEPLDPASLTGRWRALQAGPSAGRLASRDDPKRAEAVQALLRAIDAAGVDAPRPPRFGERSGDQYGYAAGEFVPGAVLGWIARVEGTRRRSTAAMAAAWDSWARSQIGGVLDEHLLPGTGIRTVVVPEGAGVASVRVIALVDPATAVEARLSLATALLLAESAFDFELSGGEGARLEASSDQLLIDLALPIDADVEAEPSVVRGSVRTLLCAPEERLADVVDWRIDRSGLDQSTPAAAKRVRKLAKALGGSEAWADTGSVRFTATLDMGGGRDIDIVQWRDLDGPRVRLEQRGDPVTVTWLDGRRAFQSDPSGALVGLPDQTASALAGGHRSSLLVVLQDLVGDERLRARLDEDVLILDDESSREVARLTLGSNGLPSELSANEQTWSYGSWTRVDGRRVPRRAERVGDRPAKYAWSDFEWNPALPTEFGARAGGR